MSGSTRNFAHVRQIRGVILLENFNNDECKVERKRSRREEKGQNSSQTRQGDTKSKLCDYSVRNRFLEKAEVANRNICMLKAERLKDWKGKTAKERARIRAISKVDLSKKWEDPETFQWNQLHILTKHVRGRKKT